MVGGTTPPQSDSGEISRVLVLNLLWQSKRCSRTDQDISVLTTTSLLSKGCPKLIPSFHLQRAQHLLINIPLLQNGKNCLRPKPCARELPENARGLLLVFWLLQSLTAQILPRLLLFIYFFVGRADRFLDHLTMHSLDLQISDHPSAPEFFVIAAEG